MRAPSQIAADVLIKLAEEDEWTVPEMGTLGGGLGLGAGLAGAGLTNKGNIEDLLRLHYQRPQLESSREDLDELLAGVKKKNPHMKKMRPRQLTHLLLENKDKISPEAYYAARRGHEEGLSGLSRNQKLTQLLKKRLMRAGGLGAGLGLGAGVGAGLLAAIGSGKFDDSES
jgi:hypothetical protein